MLCGGHGERLLIQKSDDTLLAQHQLNHSFSLVLVELIFFICSGLAKSSRRHRTGSRRVDQIDTDTKTWLSGVHLHLSMFLVLFTLRLNLVNSLLEENL